MGLAFPLPADLRSVALTMNRLFLPTTLTLLPAAILLSILAPLAPALGKGFIAGVEHTATHPLKAGDDWTVTMIGARGGQAHFEILGVTASIPMQEVAAGRYEVRFPVPQGLAVVDGLVVVSLAVNGKTEVMEANRLVNIVGDPGGASSRPAGGVVTPSPPRSFSPTAAPGFPRSLLPSIAPGFPGSLLPSIAPGIPGSLMPSAFPSAPSGADIRNKLSEIVNPKESEITVSVLDIQAVVLIVFGALFGFAGQGLFRALFKVAGFLFFGLISGAISISVSAGNLWLALVCAIAGGFLGVMLLNTFLTGALVALGISAGYLIGEQIVLLRISVHPQLPIGAAVCGAALALFGQDLLLIITTSLWGGAFMALGGAHLADYAFLNEVVTATDLTQVPQGLPMVAIGLAIFGFIVQLKRKR